VFGQIGIADVVDIETQRLGEVVETFQLELFHGRIDRHYVAP
jgi:hypothetical protein